MFSKKAQVSVEFIIIFILIFFIFLYALYVVNQKSSIIEFTKENISAEKSLEKVGELINQVYFSENYLEKKVFLGLNDNYYFEVYNYNLYLVEKKSNAKYNFKIFTNNVDFNNTQNNILIIKNVFGNIVINDG